MEQVLKPEVATDTGYLSTVQVSEQIGVNKPRVLQMARNRGIVPVAIPGVKGFLWRRSDLKKFDRRPPGRPKLKRSDRRVKARRRK